MKQKLFALFAAAALLLGMGACTTTNDDNPSGGTGGSTEIPAQLKQGIWTEYDTAFVASGKKTMEELAEMPTVGMKIEGDKAYFFTYTADDASEPVEGNVSYNKSTEEGTITFPAIKDNPLSGQTISFTATSDETLQFELTYEGQKTTATLAWLCENTDDWFTEITDEDWKELMAYYQTIDENAGPDPTIDWSDSDVEGLDKPLVWEDDATASTKARTRSTVGSTVETIGNVFSSLFQEDPNAEINEKLDELLEKVDQVLANQQVMMQKLDEINARLIAIANKLNQQETVNIFNTRNSIYFNPLDQQNIKYIASAYDLYTKNKGNLSQETKDKLGEYAKLWVGSGETYADLTWQYMKYITTVQHSSYGTGMDKIYDALVFDKYPWEHMGIGDRQTYRAYDLIMIAKSLFMICLYAQYGGLTDSQKEGLYNAYSSYTSQLKAFSEFNVTNTDKFIVCQIPGAHIVMHKEIQEYNYGDKGSDAPDPRAYGRDAIYMPKWHVAGSIKISNPAEMKTKLIYMKEMNAIRKYFAYNQWTWYNMLIEGLENSGGMICKNKPANALATLLLYDNENVGKNGAATGINVLNAILQYKVFLRIYSVMFMFATYEHIDIEWLENDKNAHKWESYNGPKLFYAAIVEKHF